LLVTHDRYLIRRLATQVWVIQDGMLWEFPEGYEEYRQWEAQRVEPGPSPARAQVDARRTHEREAHRAAERQAARLAHRQAELEDLIHRLETRRAELEHQLTLASEQQQVERVRQLGDEYAGIESELDTLLAAWTDAL
jgi:ATP-binding cassette subfamily F protein 3